MHEPKDRGRTGVSNKLGGAIVAIIAMCLVGIAVFFKKCDIWHRS